MEPLQRKTKREQITEFFVQNLGEWFRSDHLHRMFGSAFRTRVSEINRLDGPIRILSKTTSIAAYGFYYAEWK